MTEKRRGARGEAARRNQFRKGAKYSEATVIRLVYCFCQGVGLAAAARMTGLSQKTVRGVYLALRGRLCKPAFNRWHGTGRTLIAQPSRLQEMLIRAEYFLVLAHCAENATCARNYRLGNRKARRCRDCPLPGWFPERDWEDVFRLIDGVHAFYAHLGLRGEKSRHPGALFRERMIHTTVIGTVRASSRIGANGLFDPLERSFLCGGTLMDMLLTDLAEDPLG